MPGGSPKAWPLVKDILQAASAQVEGAPCCDWVGEGGAGHFVKMVHNGIEYGDMQLICEADVYKRQAYDYYLDEMKKYHSTRFGRGPIGGIRYGGTSSISANVGQGFGTMATPDGRRAHEPLAEGCSPAHSMDKNGPTAVFKTLSKLPTHEITGGVLLNQKVTPCLLYTSRCV